VRGYTGATGQIGLTGGTGELFDILLLTLKSLYLLQVQLDPQESQVLLDPEALTVYQEAQDQRVFLV
jgi:hypothetical protein